METQQCMKCYGGFVVDTLTGGCVIDPIDLNPPVDMGCRKWNWGLQVC